MAERIDELRAPENCEAADQAAYESRPTKNGQYYQAKHNTAGKAENCLIGGVLVAQEAEDWIFHQIGRLLYHFFVGLHTLRIEHPFVQRVQEPIAGGMRIT